MLTVEGKNFDWKNIPLIDCADGNAKDTYATAKVYLTLLNALREKKLEKLYEKLISPLTVAFRDIEYEGLLIDTDKMGELGKELLDKIGKAHKELAESAKIDDTYNLRSTKDLIKILYSLARESTDAEWEVVDNIGFGLYPFEFTKKGSPSTSEETIVKLKSMIDEECMSRGLLSE